MFPSPVTPSEEYYRLLFMESRVPVVVLDAESGTCVDCNLAAAKIHGHSSREEIIGKTFIDVSAQFQYDGTPSDIKGREYIDECASRGYAHFEWRQRRPTGELWDADIYLTLFQVSGRKFLQVRTIDITDRKFSDENIIHLSEERRTILETVTIGISYVKFRKIQWTNTAFAEMFGYAKSELEDMDTLLFYANEDDYNRVGFEGYAAIRSGSGYSIEAIMKRKDGSRFTCLIFGKALNPEKTAEGSIWTLQDVTKPKAIEKAIRTNEERYRIVAEISGQLHYEYSVLTGEIKWAGRICDITGFEPDEFNERGISGWESLIHPDDRARVIQSLDDSMKNKTPFRALYRFMRKDGLLFPVEDAGIFIYGDSGNAVRMVGAIKDESYRQTAEKEQNRLQEQLQQAMKMEAVGRLAGGVAHDFNNLLTAIIGNIDLARASTDDNDPISGFLDQAVRVSESAATLTRQLLAFSRRQIIEPRIIDLNDLIRDLGKILVRLIGEDIKLMFCLEKKLAPVEIDPGQFEQVLINLSVNARDAMPDGGTLRVETSNTDLDEHYCGLHAGAKPGPHVLLAISDTGQGMDSEMMDHLFEPFYTTKEKGRGTGLGLAMVFGTVKQAGGLIEVYSEPGMGTTIKIYLPKSTGAPGKLDHPVPKLELERGTETILLVEDNEEVRTLGTDILRRQGYNVLTAQNGREAVLVSKKHNGNIDLLLTDVVMPGINGRKLADKLQKSRPGMKVLYTSGYTENVIVHHGIVEKSLNFIAKPYTPYKLSMKVREVLDMESP